MAKGGWTLNTTPGGILAGIGLLAARRGALLRAGITLQGEWKKVLNQPGSGETRSLIFRTVRGRVIPVGKAAVSHTASRPGDPPAPDTGALRQSIAVVEDGDEVIVGTGLRYGLALEYGVNVSGSKVGPHPDGSFVLQARPHARLARRNARRGMTKGVKLGFNSNRVPLVQPNEL